MGNIYWTKIQKYTGNTEMVGTLTNWQTMRETHRNTWGSATNKTQVKLMRVSKEQRRAEHTVIGVCCWFLSKLYGLYYKIAPWIHQLTINICLGSCWHIPPWTEPITTATPMKNFCLFVCMLVLCSEPKVVREEAIKYSRPLNVIKLLIEITWRWTQHSL